MRRLLTPDEALKRKFRADLLEAARPQIRDYSEPRIPAVPAWSQQPPAWMRGLGVLKNPCHDVDGHGVAWCAWNGDRSRGWAFYCACGFCTPMRRSFSDGMELMETHWDSAGKQAAA